MDSFSQPDQQRLCDAIGAQLARDELRVHLGMLGFPVDDYSDEEIDAGVLRTGKLVGSSESEAIAAIRRLAAEGIDVRLLMRPS